jgi:hypothetical protein
VNDELDFEGSCHGLILRYYPGISLEGVRKTMKIYSSQDSLFVG